MKEHILELDRPREIRYGFRSLKMIGKAFGEDVGIEQLMEIKMHQIPDLVYPGLAWEDKELTVDKVMDLLDASIPEKNTMIGITTVALEALAAHMGVEIDIKKTIASALEEAEKEAEAEAKKSKKKDPKSTFPSKKSSKKPKKPH